MINSRELVRKNYKCENCLNTETKLINPMRLKKKMVKNQKIKKLKMKEKP